MDNPQLSPADKAAIEKRINIMEVEDASMYCFGIPSLLVVQLMKWYRDALKHV